MGIYDLAFEVLHVGGVKLPIINNYVGPTLECPLVVEGGAFNSTLSITIIFNTNCTFCIPMMKVEL